MDKMAVRAYELKKRREDERKAVVQEKLYQQWRSGVDELRTMDSQVVQLKVIADRDYQLDEKQAMIAEDQAHDEFYDRLWHEGYLAKIEREEREKELKRERNTQQVATLGVQLDMKDKRIQEEKDMIVAEGDEMKKLWAAQEREEKEAIVRERKLAKEERKKADEYMAIQQAQRADEERVEKVFDKNFVAGVLERERKVAEMEAAEKTKAKKKAVEYTEALKLEMARKAESEEQLIRLQHEESERQWQKRYDQWEKEELARRNLMEDVYNDRAEQVRLKQHQRERTREEFEKEKIMIQAEVDRVAAIEKERLAGEAFVHKCHQESLFKQMDHHQVEREKQLEEHAREQKKKEAEEEKIRRAVESEKKKAQGIMQDVVRKRNEANMARTQGSGGVVAPWDR